MAPETTRKKTAKPAESGESTPSKKTAATAPAGAEKKTATRKAPAKKAAASEPSPAPAPAAAAPASTAAATPAALAQKAPAAPAKTAESPSASKPVTTPTAPATTALEVPAPGSVISMKPPIVVKDLAARVGLKAFQVVHELMEMNVFATLNQVIDEETAKKVCERKGFVFELERRKEGGGVHKVEEKVEIPVPPPVETTLQVGRPPIITFMGHVDHGKTSLLDAVRKTKVAAGEAGGITQHIGAYSITRNGQSITFLDTPGHEAFTAMRARGANLTDIAVIVVAADDGLMPQTREAIAHAKAAKVKIMVALNKIDVPGALPDRVKQQLQEVDLTPEDWGGDTVVCLVSATKGTGISEFIDLMILQAELLELKADHDCPARGTVVESRIDVGKGANATIIVQQGTLKIGDPFVCGPFWGKVKAMLNDQGQPIKVAGPSTPVQVLGFSGSPTPGEEFHIMRNEREARQLGEEREAAARLDKLSTARPVTLENLFDSIADGQKKTLNLIIKSDVQGSLEAIINSLNKIPTNKVEIHYVLGGVGPISVNDVLLAKASAAVIIGFSTKVDNAANAEAKRQDIQIKLYSIIYELIDQVKEAMAGLLDPELRESSVGKAAVKKVFSLSKFPVAGCIVEQGRIVRTGRARVIRRNQPVYDGSIQTLKRFQDDAAEVRNGMECGIRLGNFDDYMENDIIECYILEKVPQAL
ncbi:MAG: translation initiation factor IF-2 [Candidatus Methylacidiphilales bacterium]|nr:translation initiation factor IF-2 [Candidatus Methylacidiphilales bacterium]